MEGFPPTNLNGWAVFLRHAQDELRPPGEIISCEGKILRIYCPSRQGYENSIKNPQKVKTDNIRAGE